jgi:nicotinamidase-related amidase
LEEAVAERDSDLHGSAPDTSAAALLLVDVINTLEFPEADDLLRDALPAADRIAALKRRAKAAGVPTVYANDNFGRWRSDLSKVVERCREPGCKGRPLAERLAPDADDYFVLKPKHSAFYSTTLDTLLRYLGTRTVIVAGFAANICVLFTANDAYMRDLRVAVPGDCVAANTPEEAAAAVEQMRKVLKADVRPAAEWTEARLRRAARGESA